MAAVSLTGDPLIEAVTAAVRAHMSRYDGSHDFSHIRRVVGLAAYIAAQEQQTPGAQTTLDLRLITLCALLHDVGDRKYLDLVDTATATASTASTASPSHKDFEDPGAQAIANVLRRCDAPEDLVRLVPVLCQNVSWSAETKSAESAAATAALIVRHPELAVVQDADRLDSIGAIGVARCFAYGGARGGRGHGDNSTSDSSSRTLQASLDHFDQKLLHVGARMKTATGRIMAHERTHRLSIFQAWFREEANIAVPDPLESS